MTWLLVLMACVDGGKDGGTKEEEPRDTAETSTDTHDGEDSGETDTTSGSSATLTGDGAFTAASVLFWYYQPDWSPEILITEWEQECEDFRYSSGDPSFEGEGPYLYMLGETLCNDGVSYGEPEWSSSDCENLSVASEGVYGLQDYDSCDSLDPTETCRLIWAITGTANGPSESGEFTRGEYTEASEVLLDLTRYTNDGAEGSFRIDGLEGTFTSVTNCGPSEEGE